MVDVSPDGRRFASAGQDTVARLWSTSTGQPVGPPLKFIIHVKYIHFNPDGRRLLGNSCDQAARVWDLATASASTVRVRPTFENERRLISADGNYVLQPGRSNVVWITDTRSLKHLAALPHSDPVTYASISRDGHAAITASERETAVSSMRNEIFLWDIPSGKRLNQVPMSHSFRLLYAAFSPDNTRLLTCGFDFTARLWDAHTGQPLSPPLRHREQIRWGAFSPSGKMIATASWDRTVRVWDAANGEPLTPPLMHKSIVIGARWSSDGKRLYTVTTDDFLQIWDLAAGEPLTPPRRIQPDSGIFEAPELQSGGKFEELSLDNRPVGDLELLAQMLAVGRIDAGGNVIPLRLQELTNAWHILHNKYPSQFATTASEVMDWHRREAQDSEAEGNPRAALFHLDRALERAPDDPAFKKMRVLTEAQFFSTNSVKSSVKTRGVIPARDPAAQAGQIDLSEYYNLALGDSADQNADGNDLLDLKPGTKWLGGVQFDARGWIQLSGQNAKLQGLTFPEHLDGIRVAQRCRTLHFLQATGWDAEPGTQVGSYVLHYADGGQAELTIVYGRETSGWWITDQFDNPTSRDPILPAWIGRNTFADQNACGIRLFVSSRDNPRPDVEITTVDFKSAMSSAAPFLVALTVDDRPATPQTNFPSSKQAYAARNHERFPRRNPGTEANQIDLSAFYNVDLHTSEGADFGDMVAGNHTLGGVRFDIRGAVYVSGRIAKDGGSSLPEIITGIKVGKKCQRLHFLQGTGWDAPRGATVGKYILHYADGQQSELPIVFGQDTEAWWRQGPPLASEQPGAAIPVWSGSNRKTEKDGCSLFLYKSTRENPRPDSELASIDLVSSMSPGAPFLVALTVE
jgi:WD40 repeat protein